jgi:hypothetical protein
MRVPSPRVGVKRPRLERRVAAAVTAACGLLVAGLAAWATFGAALGAAGVRALVIALLGMAMGLLRFSWPRGTVAHGGRPGALGVEGGELVVETAGRRRRYALSAVARGWRELDTGSERVVLELGDGTVVWGADLQPETARALLERIGAGVSAHALRLELEPPAHVRTAAGCLFMLAAGVAVPLVAFAFVTLLPLSMGVEPTPAWAHLLVGPLAALAFFGLWTLLRSLFRSSLLIGRDGVHVRRPLRRGRFVRYADLVHAVVEGFASELRLELRGARPLVLPAEPVAADAAVRRIEEAVLALPRDGAVVDLRALDRGDRSVSSWLADAATLLRMRGYRERTVAASDLVGIAEDPRAPVERRIAAAAALAPVADAPLKRRLRIAAQSCGNPPLRIVMESAAEGDLDLAAQAEAEVAIAADRVPDTERAPS